MIVQAGLEVPDPAVLLAVLNRVKRGDFTARLPEEWTGMAGKISDAFNAIVEENQRTLKEIERLGQAVGKEGKTSQRASATQVGGGWARELDAVNSLIDDLVWPVTEMSRVVGAVAEGDLSQSVALDSAKRLLKGDFLNAARTANRMVGRLSSFAAEVTRVAREVGTDGKLGGQAQVKGVSGTWRDLTESVNSMASNLTSQVRNIADVTTAVATGDLTRKIEVEARGEILELKNTVNTMVDQLNAFAAEVTRVAREVGTDGKLGGQAQVKGVSGTWKDLTDNVNFMAANLTNQVRNIADVTTAVAKGILTRRITVDAKGEILELKDTVNTMVDQLSGFAAEVTRVAREVGTDGNLGGQAEVVGVSGAWKDLTESVNSMAANLTGQVRNIADVTTAVAKGDLTRKIEVKAKGEILQLKNTINTMVDQLNAFAAEVTRVAREVGTDGKLGGQAQVKGVSGTWRDLTDNVNLMAANLTSQVRNIADVTTAVAKGNLTLKITVDAKGEILSLKNTVNTMVDRLNAFAAEVTRVAREVGTDGKLGGQAQVKGVAGTWRDLTESVNSMAANLTNQVRNIANVTTAVAKGDLSRKITVDAKGEILELKDTMNTMVDQLRAFASEVTRVAREVGSDGNLGGQAVVQGVAGTWKDLTDNVNFMAGNLTSQVRNIAQVTTAVANGDLAKKITVDAKGEILELKDTMNTMVDQLRAFASEVTRVAREVGSDGNLGGQAVVQGVAGTWKDLTDNVNFMAGNLTSQVRNIAQVTTAVANGDLAKKITVDAKGEILELKDTMNTMVDQLRAFASEVTRVAREVGTDGKLGGQAQVRGVSGTWKDLTESVNSMASNLTDQVRNIADVTVSVANGDLSKKITVDVRGEFLELKDTMNTMVDQLRAFASEVTRVAREVGSDGKLGGQAYVQGVAGTWKDLTESVNSMANNLTSQVRNVAQVTTAVANGDLSKKITVDAKGEMLELKDTINTMVDQLNAFAAEVTRVAREVGTDGKLGGQAQVKGVSGTWRDLTENVNSMATNLTDQVRGIVKVVTAVANGDLKQKLAVQAKGEIAALADTINGMTETLATFADQVTGVAREVGVEGKLGGQANVPGAAGTWQDLTNNVNQLAANLTAQVRAISEVSLAVTKGDLTRSVGVEAQGEVAALKDIVNEMIRNLRVTTEKKTEQDWLKTNLAKFTRMLQGQKDVAAVAQMLLSELAPVVNAHQGVFYRLETSPDGEPALKLMASYAYNERKSLSAEFKVGEGLIGQAVIEKKRILLTSAPNDYVQISSGLGQAAPNNILVSPIVFEDQVKAVMELASFEQFSATHLAFLDQLTDGLGIVLNTIEAGARTEDLLRRSQSMGEEMKSQQEELQQTNEELEEKAKLLSDQNSAVEQKNQEIEQARAAIEEKAAQLTLTSRYKSEFLANMSHELRTPLNSLLILAQQLHENPDGNLTAKQVEFASTIHSSGADLLALINDILDLSKIESGTVTVDVSEARFADVKELVERTFSHVAEQKKIHFAVEMAGGLPPAILTDAKRLQQVLKNLLSNSFKFTEKGSVRLTMEVAAGGWNRENRSLARARQVIAFSVCDTGIGIAPDKQRVIFEAFQQGDGSTARKYGGTGLGLSISREIASLLGGEIRLASESGKGSTFTFYLPQEYREPEAPRGRTRPDGRPSRPEGQLPVLAADQTPAGPAPEVKDDRALIQPGDKVLLIVEDDAAFAQILLDAAHERGFKGIISPLGRPALSMARDFKPDAVTLDINLPDVDGWRVLNQLKEDPATRHIPVQVITVEEEPERARERGALAFLTKPLSREKLVQALDDLRGFVERRVKYLLVVEDNDVQRANTVELIGNGDVKTVAVGTGAEALAAVQAQPFDCIVLDLGLPDMSGFDLLERLSADPASRYIPVIVYTAKDLSKKEETRLRRLAKTIVVKDVRSPERLLDETALFLHRVQARLPEEKRRMVENLHQSDALLSGKTVLIVDDDIRNIFALTSVLERYGLKVLSAENGKDALEVLTENSGIDAALMDIMMPEMDGYETMRQIRKLPRFRSLPILALTAKAMKGDREKCIESGASDYMAKPVDVDQLLSMLRVWLYR